MTKLTVTEAKAKTKTLGPAEAAEDKNRRMAIAAARADRAESLAYHLADLGMPSAWPACARRAWPRP
jgi:hypothetical protein